MTVRVNKPAFNIREKLKELTNNIGMKGRELMSAVTVQEARDLVGAGRKNLIINGDMRISQRATNVIASNNTYNTVDRWNTWINYGSGTVAMTQSGSTPPGFIYSLQYYNNGNAASVQYHFVEQKIEAQNIPQLKMGTSDAEYMTLSFWVRSSVTGTFNVELTDDDGSHHLIKRYTIDNADTWEYKTITIPPATNTGVPTYDNTVGLTLGWWISGGSSYNGTSADGTWQTFATPRRNDGGNTVFEDPDFWNITGVQLEVGKNATEFEHRPIGEELALCQRYYFKLSDSRLVAGYKRHDSSSNFQILAPVPMRAEPDPTLLVGGSFTNMQTNFNTTQSSPNVYQWDGHSFMFQVSSTWSSTHTFIPSWEGFTVEFDAEL
jgi:hypothetical protein